MQGLPRGAAALLVLAGSLALPAALPPPLAEDVRQVRAVGPEGQGHAAAGPAGRRLARAEPAHLPDLLAAMDGANDYALNWLRAAVESIAGRAGRQLPVPGLTAFLADRQHHPRARRLAYELLRTADPAAAARLLPGFLDDPANELRRDAVQQLADQARETAGRDQPAARATLRQALASARDVDQIEALARQLGELGEKVDLRQTLGWVTRWKVAGPFDNTGGAGFDRVFPPEQSADPAAEMDGKSGRVKWQDLETRHDYGLVDFNQPYTPLKGVTGYALAEFWSDTPRPAEIRLGCKNGWKVWLNGRLLFGRDEYHRGAEIDQYRMAAPLQAGRNVILVKCCQNEQTEDWTKEWEFQLRVTDAQGTPIRSTR